MRGGEAANQRDKLEDVSGDPGGVASHRTKQRAVRDMDGDDRRGAAFVVFAVVVRRGEERGGRLLGFVVEGLLFRRRWQCSRPV